MNVKTVVARQYRQIVNQDTSAGAQLHIPAEGWMCTVRKALNMSAAQLASRLGVTRADVWKKEKAELSGAVSLKTIKAMAEAMGCRFVYAIVPEDNIDTLIMDQARKKATALVKKTNSQMALEAQTLSSEQIEYEIQRLTKDLADRMPADLWDEV